MITLTEVQEAHQDYLNAKAEAERLFKAGGVSDHYTLAVEDADLCWRDYIELKEKLENNA